MNNFNAKFPSERRTEWFAPVNQWWGKRLQLRGMPGRLQQLGGSNALSLSGMQNFLTPLLSALCQGFPMKFSKLKTLSVALSFVLASAGSEAVFARPGDIDVTFGGTGNITLNSYAGISVGPPVLAATKDGKILFAGMTSNPNQRYAVFAPMGRLNNNGSPDISFHPDATTIDWIPALPYDIYGVQLIGGPGAAKIVVDKENNAYVLVWPQGGGIAAYMAPRVVKVKPDGNLDASFTDGFLPNCNYSNFCTIFGMSLDAQGRILVTGAANLYEQMYVARLLPDGTPDSSFGNNGYIINPAGTYGLARDINTDLNGKVVVSGQLVEAETRNILGAFVLRLNSDGTQDTTFAENGYFTSPVGGASGLALLSDNSILVAGYLANPTDSTPSIAGGQVTKLTPNGTLDASFGTNGVALNPGGSSASIIRLTKANRILVAGGNKLMRFLANGKIDTKYGSNGVTQLTGSIIDVAIQPDDKAVTSTRSTTGVSEQKIYRTQGGASLLLTGLMAGLFFRRKR